MENLVLLCIVVAAVYLDETEACHPIPGIQLSTYLDNLPIRLQPRRYENTTKYPVVEQCTLKLASTSN